MTRLVPFGDTVLGQICPNGDPVLRASETVPDMDILVKGKNKITPARGV